MDKAETIFGWMATMQVAGWGVIRERWFIYVFLQLGGTYFILQSWPHECYHHEVAGVQ